MRVPHPCPTCGEPIPADAPQGVVIHHPHFGVVLKERMDALGIRCEVSTTRWESDPRLRWSAAYTEMVERFGESFAKR